MPACEFGERQYELAGNLELLAGSGKFFAPTTSVEAHLAIDVALTPGDPRIWSLLGVTPPRGVVAGPATFRGWPASAVTSASPPFLVSLFIQYKRSTHLTRATAKEWTTHRARYWRVEITAHQHRILQDLEFAVGSDAVVRYAAPTFWRHAEMWQFQGAGAVMDNSLFAAPSRVRAQHTRMTWSPAAGLFGHSERESLLAGASEEVGREIVTRVDVGVATAYPKLRDVIFEALARAVAEMTPSQRGREQWRHEIATRPEIRDLLESDEAIEPLADISAVAEAAHAAGASWLMVAVANRD